MVPVTVVAEVPFSVTLALLTEHVTYATGLEHAIATVPV